MAMAKIDDKVLHYNGIKYFRVGSEDVKLGAYGQKRKPVLQGNYLEVFKNIPFGKLKVQKPVKVQIDFKETTKNDFDAQFDKGAVVGAKGGNVRERLQDHELELVKLTVRIGDMVDALNDAPAARRSMIDFGADARVAHQIFIVADATLAETLTSATSISVTGTDGEMRLKVTNEHTVERETEVVVSDRSTFAYLLMEPEWDHARRARRERLVGGHDDQWSMV